MGPGRDRTPTPGSAVSFASVTRHVTDCATRPCKPFKEVDLINTVLDENSKRLENHNLYFIHTNVLANATRRLIG